MGYIKQYLWYYISIYKRDYFTVSHISNVSKTILSARRQKGLTEYCFKYIDRPFCLRTDYFMTSYISQLHMGLFHDNGHLTYGTTSSQHTHYEYTRNYFMSDAQRRLDLQFSWHHRYLYKIQDTNRLIKFYQTDLQFSWCHKYLSNRPTIFTTPQTLIKQAYNFHNIDDVY